MKSLAYLFFALSLSTSLTAQTKYFLGYQNEISGTRFTYHSPFSNSDGSLLSRANKHFEPIEWNTEIIPVDYEEATVSFVWVYGIDVLPKSQSYNIYVNDKMVGSFSSPKSNDERVWVVQGEDGARLVFNRTMIDKHKDQMGFAVLTLPTSSIQLGKAARIKIDGVDNESDAWYMTFKIPLRESISVSQLNTVAKMDDGLVYTARFNIVHLSDAVEASIRVQGKEEILTLLPGQNAIDLSLPIVTETTNYQARIAIEGRASQVVDFTLSPVKEWTVHLVQHSHTDIGYTRSQTEILAEHLRFIDYALDYCDQTDDYPDEAKFRWTCEAAWTVREYLKGRPQSQIDRLLQRIKEGRIEVTGMFFNFSEVVDETALAVQTQTLKLFKEKGIDVKTAMQNDVNGIGWCMIDYYKDTGVKYLTMGQHGHRAQIPFDKPTSFWWESPAGNRLLAYRSEHYMHGNALSLTSGNIDVFRANLSNYLNELETKGYPFDRTAFQFSGYVTDNSPPSIAACDIVKEWNEKYEWPKLKISLANEFMMFLDESKSDEIPVKKEAWPDWWADGFGSAMNETKAARNTHAEMIANMGLLSMAKIMGAEIPTELNDDIEDCYDNLLFYDEHTFGAAESITDPSSENTVVQWGQKSAYAWSAVKESGIIKEKALGYIQPFIDKSLLPTVAVFNTLNWERSGLVHVYIDHDILPLDKPFRILDQNGNNVKAELISSRNDGSTWALWAPNIPAMGFAIFQIEVNKSNEGLAHETSPSGVFENKYYRLNMNREKGTMSSLFDKELNQELIDQNSKMQLGEFIHEQLEDRRAMERLTNTNRDTVYVPLIKKMQSLTNIRVSDVLEGPIWSSIKINGRADEAADERGVDIEIRLFNNEKKIEFHYSMRKLKINSPEAIYVAFPFKMSASDQLTFEVQGGTVQPGMNQLEGTSADWNVIQNFAAVTNNNSQIVFSSKSIPLVQFGDINTGHFYYKHRPETAHIYSWVLNNYWTTNFKASQEGEMKWSYSITSSSNITNSFATRFGWSDRIPLLARVIPGGTTESSNKAKSVLDFDIPNLLLVNAKPMKNRNAIILHLRETEGNHAILDVNDLIKQTSAKAITEVNVLGEELQKLSKPLLFEHFETKFVLIELK